MCICNVLLGFAIDFNQFIIIRTFTGLFNSIGTLSKVNIND